MKICLYCKKEINNKNKKYCSSKCQILDYAQNPDIKQKRAESLLRYFKKHPEATAFAQTKEYKEKMSKATSGKKNGMYGKIQKTETRKKISLKLLGKKDSLETRIKKSESHTGLECSLKRKEAIGKALKGSKRPWARITWEKYLKGRKPWNLGYGDYIRGEKNPMYKGGNSSLYPVIFREPLKRKIRERDNYTCQFCGKRGKSVHHKDEDKENNFEMNLITLCKSCHQKIHARNLNWNQALLVLNPRS